MMSFDEETRSVKHAKMGTVRSSQCVLHHQSSPVIYYRECGDAIGPI